MTSIIRVHVISGGAEGGESPQCYILQVDELRLLLDAGWDINHNSLNHIKEIKKFVCNFCEISKMCLFIRF